MTLTAGCLFAGMGGLELGLSRVLDVRPAWVSEIDPAASKVLAHRFPQVPNLGDITAVDWARVEPVDVLTGGYPCQPESNAGKRLGMDDDRWLWPAYLAAIRGLRPSLAVGENVAGHVRRGLRHVIADLQSSGYAVAWRLIQASDVGMCHERARVFWVAWPDTGARPQGYPFAWLRGGAWTVEGLFGDHPVESWPAAGVAAAGVAAAGGGDVVPLLPTPRTTDTNGAGRHGEGGMDLRTAISLLPTPTVRDEKGHNQRRDSSCLTGALLPTPRASDGDKGGPNQRGSSGDLMLSSAVHPDRWGRYAAAVARQEAVWGVPAPEPTRPDGLRDQERLSPYLPEWMMGLPPGWIVDVPGVSRNAAIRAAGNGVVPQQCAAAVASLLPYVGARVAAA